MKRAPAFEDFMYGLIAVVIMLPSGIIFLVKAYHKPILYLPFFTLLFYIYLTEYKVIIKEKSFGYTITNIGINTIFAANVVNLLMNILKFFYNIIR